MQSLYFCVENYDP